MEDRKDFVEIFGRPFYFYEYDEDRLIIGPDELPLSFTREGKHPDLLDVKGLERFTHLDALTLKLGGITKICNLQDFVQLRALNLSHNRITKIEDLALVCSNCHKMLHKKKEDGSYHVIESLKEVIKQNIG